jgi:hypothetical protein
MSGLPTRREWADACRTAVAEPGGWQRVGDGGPFWVTRPVRAPAGVPATLQGHAGDVTFTVDDVIARFGRDVVERLRERGAASRSRGLSALFGHAIRVTDGDALHARTRLGWVRDWADRWVNLRIDPDAHPELVPAKLLATWQATRWRGQLLLIVWGGRRGASVAAPGGTMVLDWSPWKTDVATVQLLTLWDAVTAALLEAGASGADPVDAALAAVTPAARYRVPDGG